MTLPRSYRPELLDEEVQDEAELAHSLGQVTRVNRWLGGTRGLRAHLRPLLEDGAPLTVLDVGTGDGGTLSELLAWARERGGRWRGVGLDRGRAAARIAARRPGAVTLRADARTLPLADDTVDVALCTLTLHHFDETDATAILREMRRVARRLVLVSDLERHRLAWLAARALAATVWRTNRLTRHDGPLSVLRSFTPGELRALGEDAGLREPRVRRWFPWRLVLEGRP